MNELTKKVNEEPIKKARQVFAEYGLDNDSNPRLKQLLSEYEARKNRTATFGGVHRRNCYSCGSDYFGGTELCHTCIGVYENEKLFWEQGKVVE